MSDWVIVLTIPNRLVNTMSKKLFAYDQNGTTHPTCLAAAAGVGQMLSVTKAGVVLFSHPQQLNCTQISDLLATVMHP